MTKHVALERSLYSYLPCCEQRDLAKSFPRKIANPHVGGVSGNEVQRVAFCNQKMRPVLVVYELSQHESPLCIMKHFFPESEKTSYVSSTDDPLVDTV
jgi:hypothetical protein